MREKRRTSERKREITNRAICIELFEFHTSNLDLRNLIWRQRERERESGGIQMVGVFTNRHTQNFFVRRQVSWRHRKIKLVGESPALYLITFIAVQKAAGYFSRGIPARTWSIYDVEFSAPRRFSNGVGQAKSVENARADVWLRVAGFRDRGSDALVGIVTFYRPARFQWIRCMIARKTEKRRVLDFLLQRRHKWLRATIQSRSRPRSSFNAQPALHWNLHFFRTLTSPPIFYCLQT